MNTSHIIIIISFFFSCHLTSFWYDHSQFRKEYKRKGYPLSRRDLKSSIKKNK